MVRLAQQLANSCQARLALGLILAQDCVLLAFGLELVGVGLVDVDGGCSVFTLYLGAPLLLSTDTSFFSLGFTAPQDGVRGRVEGMYLLRRFEGLLEPYLAPSRSLAPAAIDLRFLPVDLHFRFVGPGSLLQGPQLACLSYTRNRENKILRLAPCFSPRLIPRFFSSIFAIDLDFLISIKVFTDH